MALRSKSIPSILALDYLRQLFLRFAQLRTG